MLPLPSAGTVNWVIRRGISEVMWKSSTQATQAAIAELPTNLPPGVYKLEADVGSDARMLDIVVREKERTVRARFHVGFVQLPTCIRRCATPRSGINGC